MSKKTHSLILIVHSHTLVDDCIVQVATNVRTDITGQSLPVHMVKECCKNCHAFDSQRIGITRTIMSNDGLLPSVEILMVAQPPPCLTKDAMMGFVRSGSARIASAARRLRGRRRPMRLSGYRGRKGPSRRLGRSAARRTRCTTLVPGGVHTCAEMRRWIRVIRRPDSAGGEVV